MNEHSAARLRGTPNGVRTFAAAVSTLIMVASLLALHKPRLVQPERSPGLVAAPVWLFETRRPPNKESAVRPTLPPRHEVVVSIRGVRTAPAVTANSLAPTTVGATGAAALASTGPAPPPTAIGAASSPLNLGADVLRAAIAGSRGAVRQLADSSGQTLDTPRPAKDDVFASAVASAGIPDCLRPDALQHDPPHVGPIGLGGILALPFLAHAAITGKCKP